MRMDVLSICLRSIDWPSLMEPMEIVSSSAIDKDDEPPEEPPDEPLPKKKKA